MSNNMIIDIDFVEGDRVNIYCEDGYYPVDLVGDEYALLWSLCYMCDAHQDYVEWDDLYKRIQGEDDVLSYNVSIRKWRKKMTDTRLRLNKKLSKLNGGLDVVGLDKRGRFILLVRLGVHQ